MSKYKELELLREQEQTLIQLHMNLSDQLNRLKVEELALTSKLRLQKEREMQAQTGAEDQGIEGEEAIEQDTMQVLDLVVDKSDTEGDEEEEDEAAEEEAEEDAAGEGDADGNNDNDQVSSFFEQLLQQQQREQIMQTDEQELHDIREGMIKIKEEEGEEDDM